MYPLVYKVHPPTSCEEKNMTICFFGPHPRFFVATTVWYELESVWSLSKSRLAFGKDSHQIKFQWLKVIQNIYICIQTLGQKKIYSDFLLCLYKICYSWMPFWCEGGGRWKKGRGERHRQNKRRICEPWMCCCARFSSAPTHLSHTKNCSLGSLFHLFSFTFACMNICQSLHTAPQTKCTNCL